MKRTVFLMLMLIGFSVYAQKQPKPNLNKVYASLKEGKIAEAKEMIDAATTYEKTMNDGKTWYYRGLVYATIDTISNEEIKALEPEPLKVALESFAKADAMSGKNEYFIQPDGITPLTKTQQIEMLANYYLDKSIKMFQGEEQDYEGSLAVLDKSILVFEQQAKTYANDTLAYFVGAIAANQAEQHDKAIEYAEKYFQKGGTSKDIYLLLYQIYSGPKEDSVKALDIVQRGKKALPNDTTFPKVEIELLINSGKEKEAKEGLMEAVAKEPNDKLLHFFLGYVNARLGNNDEARKNFQDALKLDPSYFEAQFHLANTYLIEVDRISKELSATGNTAKDSKKRSELIQQRVKASETALPYLEKAEKMKPSDKDAEIEVLQKLSLLYYYIADDKNTARVEKRLKELGVSDE
jgi:tetratricopeptide (TPR) repeat protein